MLDAVADGLLAADHDTIVFVAIWIDAPPTTRRPCAGAPPAMRRAAIADAVDGAATAAVERLVRERDALANPFYGGE